MMPGNQTRSRVLAKLLFREAAKPQMDRQARSFLAKLYREGIQQIQGLIQASSDRMVETETLRRPSRVGPTFLINSFLVIEKPSGLAGVSAWLQGRWGTAGVS
jgi:hypothetical protein